jgi:hypothetical protein
MEHSSYSPDLAPNDFWLFLKVKSDLKGRGFQDIEDIQKKCDDDSITGVPKIFPTVSDRIIGLSA